ncbi:MAG: Holliday junction branch migration protein RuvA [Bacilli bacterium]|nr:Holliday junction branch migration protein RuvA [Bacilli bacterium]
MIKYIVGTVVDIVKNTIILETAFGIAFEINVLNKEKYQKGAATKVYCFLYTFEDKNNLFGFADKNECDIFTLLNSVTGIGPKTAMQIMKNIDSNRLISYVINNKVDDLSKISGIGNKAEKLCIELKNKFNKFTISKIKYEEVYQILVSLSYKSSNVFETLKKLPDGLSNEDALKAAIKELSNG